MKYQRKNDLIQFTRTTNNNFPGKKGFSAAFGKTIISQSHTIFRIYFNISEEICKKF